MRTSCTLVPLRGLVRAAWLLALLAAGACGGDEPVSTETPLTPLVACLDACTLSCQDPQGDVDQECALACATDCLCRDACRQSCRNEDGVVDETCFQACVGRDCVTAGVR